jgi:hypothetical protein
MTTSLPRTAQRAFALPVRVDRESADGWGEERSAWIRGCTLCSTVDVSHEARQAM